MGYFAQTPLYLIIFKGFTLFQENWGTPQPVPWAIAYSPWWAIAYSSWDLFGCATFTKAVLTAIPSHFPSGE